MRRKAFSDTARFTVSDAPLGNSSDISTTRRTFAFGSEERTETISSASCTIPWEVHESAEESTFG